MAVTMTRVINILAVFSVGLAGLAFGLIPLGRLAIAVPAPSLVVLRTEPVPVSAIRRPSTIARKGVTHG